MKQESGLNPSFGRWKRLQIRGIAGVGSLLVGLVGRTLRFRVENWEAFRSRDQAGHPVIFSFWHNQIFSATYFWRHRGIVVITSRNFDGEYIARIIRRWGYGAARGSSSRGAVRALLELKRHLVEGRHVAFTIDGPRGPVYQVKPGPLWLSRKSEAAILPFHIQPKRFWSLRSWDRFRIPLPFSEVLVKIGEPFVVAPGGGEEEWLARYQAEMDRLRSYCEEYWKE